MLEDESDRDNGATLMGTPQPDSELVEFLLTEFRDASDNWRHYEARTETAVNFYLTFLAALLAAAIVVYSSSLPERNVTIATVFGAGLLFAIGYFLVRRVSSSVIGKATAIAAKSLVRAYFTDQYPAVTRYVYHFTPIDIDKDDLRRLKPGFARHLTIAVQTVNGLALGIVIAGTAHLIYDRLLPITYVLLVGLLVTVVATGVLCMFSFRKWNQFS